MNKEDEMICRTSIENRTFNFTWVIDDVVAHFELFKKDKLSSDPFTFINTKWQMHLDIDFPNQAVINIHLLECDGKNYPKVKIRASVLDRNNQPQQSDDWIGTTSTGKNITFILQENAIKLDPQLSYNPRRDYSPIQREECLSNFSIIAKRRSHNPPPRDYSPIRNEKCVPNFLKKVEQLRLLCKITMYGCTFATNKTQKNKQELSNKVLHDIAVLLTNNKLKDCVLSVQGKDISAHQLILSARSPVLSVLLESCKQPDLKRKLTIEGIEYETMLEVVKFMYTGKSGKTETMAKVLLEAADKFDMPDLRSKCQDYLISTINAGNVCDLLITGDLFNASHLKNCAKKFISDNFAEVKSTKGFFDMTDHHPHLIIEFIKNFAPK